MFLTRTYENVNSYFNSSKNILDKREISNIQNSRFEETRFVSRLPVIKIARWENFMAHEKSSYKDN